MGNSLFLFRFLLGLAWLGSFISIGLMAWLIARPDIAARHFGGLALSALLVGGGLLLLTSLAFALVELLLLDFIVPIMYRLNLKTVEAFSVFRQEILSGHAGAFVLFYLMKLCLGIAAAVLLIAGTCLTCCIAGLPYLSSVFFLPLFVFFRCYSLYFLEQFGRNGASWTAPTLRRSREIPVPPLMNELRIEARFEDSSIGHFFATQEVRLLRWAWPVPIRGAVDEAILPKPARPWSEETLVR